MKKPPKYRRYLTRNKGFVEYQKHRFYFPGNYNSAESLKAYAEFIQDLADIVETDTRTVPICESRAAIISLLHS